MAGVLAGTDFEVSLCNMKNRIVVLMAVLVSGAISSGCESSAPETQTTNTKAAPRQYPTLPPPGPTGGTGVGGTTGGTGTTGTTYTLVPFLVTPIYTLAPTTHQFSVEICGNSIDDDGDGTRDESDCFANSWVLSKEEKNLTIAELNRVQHACVFDVELWLDTTKKLRFNVAITNDERDGRPDTNLLRGFSLADRGLIGTANKIVVRHRAIGFAKCDTQAYTEMNSYNFSFAMQDLERFKSSLVDRTRRTSVAYNNCYHGINWGLGWYADDHYYRWTEIFWDPTHKGFEHVVYYPGKTWVRLDLASRIP